MKSEDILFALGETEDKFVLEGAKKKSKAKAVWIKWTAAAACICLAVLGAVGIARRSSNEPKWPVEQIYLGTASTTEATYIETAVIKKWDEKTLTEKYNGLDFEEREYHISFRGDLPLEEERVGGLLGSGLLMGDDVYTGTVHTASGEIWEIAGISPECAVAVKVEDEPGWYVYENNWYYPATLGQLTEDLDYENNVSFGGATFYLLKDDGSHSEIRFEDFEDSAVWEMLFSDLTLENQGDLSWPAVGVLTVTVEHTALGKDNAALVICEDGYVWTNLLGTMKSFFVGKEKTDGFVEWVKENVPGKEIVYVYPETEEVVEEDMGEESVVEYTSNGYVPEENSEPQTAVEQSTYTNGEGEMISPPYDPTEE